MSTPIPPEILEKINALSLPALLTFIKISKLSKEALEYAYSRIRELFQHKEYGFIPCKSDAEVLIKISKRDIFKRSLDCLGKHHPYLSLIKVGILISELNEKCKREKVKEITDQVNEKYGVHGLRVLELGSTGVIVPVIGFLSDLKLKKNLTIEDVSRELEKIIEQWKKIAIFIKSSESKTTIKNKIISKLKKEYDFVFLFSYGSASKNALDVISGLNNSNQFRRHGYLPSLIDTAVDADGLERYSWFFDYVGTR